jgi:uncharacterized surface protein with fasciclin (FAS1) repeats
MRRVLRFLLALPVVALVAASCVVPPPAESTRTIAEQLLSDSAGDDAAGFDGDWYDFDIVTEAVRLYPDLVTAVSDPNASLTVFAPNDRAFQVLAYQLTGKVATTEQQVFDVVASLGSDTIKTVLTYHIVEAKLPAADALAAPGGTALTTIQGGTVGVDVVDHDLALVILRDQDPNADDPGIVFSKFNYGGKLVNGYIHGISLVLRPADLPDVAA